MGIQMSVLCTRVRLQYKEKPVALKNDLPTHSPPRTPRETKTESYVS